MKEERCEAAYYKFSQNGQLIVRLEMRLKGCGSEQRSECRSEASRGGWRAVGMFQRVRKGCVGPTCVKRDDQETSETARLFFLKAFFISQLAKYRYLQK